MKHLTLYLLIGLGLIAATACNSSTFYDHQCDVNEHGWDMSQAVDFDVSVDDTTQVFDFLLQVRNSIAYPYSNVFFFLRTEFPDGSTAQDTLEFPLAADDGRWLGKRTGRFVDTRFYFRRNARFPMPGNYRFSLMHGMRDTSIVGLKNVGMHIDYSNKN